MTSESVQSWIGLRLDDGFQVVDVVGEGTHHIVFKITQHEKAHVLKVPRTHIGFVIDLPPNRLFPELSFNEGYKTRLLSRLNGLCGSKSLSGISPLEGLWTALAVQHLPSCDRRAQSIDVRRFSLLNKSRFVRDRLHDWSTSDVGKSAEELITEIVIYEGPGCAIHADYPEFLARDAKVAVNALDAWCADKQDRDELSDIELNPFLSWFSAMVTGYVLPAGAAGLLAQELDKRKNLKHILRQAGQVADYIRPNLSQQERAALIDFVLRVVSATSSSTADDFQAFLKPCDGV